MYICMYVLCTLGSKFDLYTVALIVLALIYLLPVEYYTVYRGSTVSMRGGRVAGGLRSCGSRAPRRVLLVVSWTLMYP